MQTMYHLTMIPMLPARAPSSQVMVFSDDASVASILADILHDDGLSVTTCCRQTALVAEVRDRQPDVLIVAMPAQIRGWGMRLLEELFRDPTIAARLVVLATDRDCIELRLAQQSGYLDAILALPTDLGQLSTTVEQIIASPSRCPGAMRVHD